MSWNNFNEGPRPQLSEIVSREDVWSADGTLAGVMLNGVFIPKSALVTTDRRRRSGSPRPGAIVRSDDVAVVAND